MELDFDKYCVVDGSPTTVLPSPGRRPKVQKRKSKGYATRENSLLSLEEDFHVISFNRYRSRSCKTISSRTFPSEYSDARKRGSVCHQSSKELRLLRKTDASEGRKKIELSETSAAALSFGIVDSLCSSDEENSHIEPDRSVEMSLNLESSTSTSTTNKPRERLHSCEFLDLPVLPAPRRGVPSHDSRKVSFDTENIVNGARESVWDSKIKSRPVILPLNNDGNSLGGKEAEAFLHKSLSAKLSLPHSPAHSETDSSRASSPKTRFGPAVRKVFDPLVKSKSQRSPLGSLREQQREASSTGSDNINKKQTFRRKTLLQDFANTGQQMEYISCPVKQCHNQPVQSSPAHLQALLKLDRKHGLPIFEFSVKSPEDVFVARTWKSENASDWVYTFHSTPEKRRSNASGRGAKESKKGSSLMGQMQVSCHSCTELKDAGVFKDSMVTEFVLYDVAHSRSTSSNDSSLEDMTREQLGRGRHSGSSDSSSSHPMHAVELHPHCEAAAIVVQFPSGKRESLKQKNGDKKLDDTYDFIQRNTEQFPDCSSPAKVNVVIPSGNHSLPATESHGPSPLLDRWRFGGGCDCGGWDMACPLNIFVNPDIQISGDHHLMESKQPLKLFIQVILPHNSSNLLVFSIT